MKVILIGNYAPDRQESMLRFAAMLGPELTRMGWEVEAHAPQPQLTKMLRHYRMAGLPKWLGYGDKYVLFPRQLRKLRLRACERSGTVFHIVDHSNAAYVPTLAGVPLVVTCHDLLAVRGALGEDTACPASGAGRILQNRILKGLDRAPMVACDSGFTRCDLSRLLPQKPADESTVVPLGLNYPYRIIPRVECLRRLQACPGLDPSRPFLLHVGSNLPRKNKPTLLKAFAKIPTGVAHQLVLAGPPLPDELRKLAQELGIAERVVGVEKPDNAQLEALYNCALALVFPSIGEGFGWPVIEAQACGCPVVCANATSLPEVAGAGAQLVEPFDSDGIAAAVKRLSDPAVSSVWSERALVNARLFSNEKMGRAYADIYARLLARPTPAGHRTSH